MRLKTQYSVNYSNQTSPFELPDDPLNGSQQVEQNVLNEFAFNKPRLVEGYAKGEAHLILEIIGGDGKQYAALLQRKVDGLCGGNVDSIEVRHNASIGIAAKVPLNYLSPDAWRNAVTNEIGERWNNQPMLIDVVEGLEMPKRLIASLIWVQRIEDLYSQLPQSFYSSSKLGRRVLRGTLANGERDQCGRGPLLRLLENCGMNQVIQRGSQILERISGKDGEDRINGFDAFDVVRSLSRLIVVFMVEDVWVGLPKGDRGMTQIKDVLLGPCSF